VTDPANPAHERAGVVVGVDGSVGAGAALRWAHAEASLRHLELTAVMAWGHLDQHHPGGGRGFTADYDEERAAAALDDAVATALGTDAGPVGRTPVCELPARALIEASATADLLVVGARGLGGFKGLLLGSVSQHCLHHASCPVAVVRDDTTSRPATHRVVVGIDGSPSSLDALRWATEEAALRHAELIVVHAWQLPYGGVHPFVGDAYDTALFQRAADGVVDEALAHTDAPGRVSVSRRVVNEQPARAIVEGAATADLAVVGARGLGGFAGVLLGSVSQHVARHATCPVVVVRPPSSEA
jgi:nucleotide-binding universal stress UspA family protein